MTIRTKWKTCSINGWRQRREHALHTSHAVQIVADALPALGIVAAVLGINQDHGINRRTPRSSWQNDRRGADGHIPWCFFLAYGFAVGPIASRMSAIVAEDDHFFQLIREVLIANMHAHPANICIEVGRQNAPHHFRPEFSALEDALRELKKTAA